MKLDRKFVNCVFPIGTQEEDEISWIGTGLLYGKELPDKPGSYYVFLVTNKHVVEDETGLVVRLNSQSGAAARNFSVGDAGEWEINKSADVAVRRVPFKLNDNDLPLDWIKESETWNLSDLIQNQVSEGDGAYVIGFPLGLVGVEIAAPIVRSAILARIQDTLAGHSKNFLIDSAVFPGNSGGPCLVVPIDNTSFIGIEIQESKLVGLVSAYVPYHDDAISRQTGEVRVRFTEHSGLSNVVPFDRVEETVISYALNHGLTNLLPKESDSDQGWDAKSFLAKLGYSTRKGGPSKAQRVEILRGAVDSQSLSQVSGHIAWLIRSFSSRPDSATYRQAIKKWQSDFDTLREWYEESGESFRWPSID